MGHGGWKTPFSVRFGGSAHEAVESNYLKIKQEIGDAFSTVEDSATDGETQAQARLLGRMDALLARYVDQSDPRALSTLLARWESILAIRPSKFDSDAKRRSRVASRLLSTYSATSEGVDAIAREAFYPWTTKIIYVDNADAVRYWPGGTSDSTYIWYSTIAHIVVGYIKPAYASRETAEKRKVDCLAALDEFMPAWATFSTSEAQAVGSNANQFGFFLDQPNLDVSCLA